MTGRASSFRDPWSVRTAVDGMACRRYWERPDGAYVWWDERTPWVNPSNPRCRLWVAFGPDGRYLAKRRRSRFRTPRRWATAEAAARAVDRAWPCDRSAVG